MKEEKNVFLDVARVTVAHEYILRAFSKSNYANGRGHYGLVTALSGSANYRFSTGEALTLSVGEVLFLLPTEAYTISVDEDFKHYTVNFDLHDETPPTFLEGKSHLLLHTQNPSPYLSLMREMSILRLHDRYGSRMREIAYLYELLSLFFFELSMEKQDKNAYRRLLPAREYIERNYANELRVEELAALSHMSPTNFRREWMKIYGETSMQYRDRIRIASAKELLLGGYNVSETALRCGFSDVGYFIRFFKKHVGVSPGTFGARI